MTTNENDDAAILEQLRLLLRPAGGGLYLVSTGAAEQKALQRRFYAGETDEDVTSAFEASLATLKQARVVVMGIPSDTGAGFHRGSNLGPQAIREAMLARQPDLRERFARDGVADAGDVVVIPQILDDEMVSFPMRERARAALYADVPDELRAELPVAPLSIAERAWRLILQLNPRAIPVTYGGDHSTAWPAVKALHDAGRRFCILQFDAHTDLLEARLGVRMCFATWSFHANNLIGRNQRLVQVGHQMNQEAQRLGARGGGPARVTEQMPRPGDLRHHTLAAGTVPRRDIAGCVKRNIDIMPGAGFRSPVADFIGPVGIMNQHRRAAQQPRHLRSGVRCQLVRRDGGDDLMALRAPGPGRCGRKQKNDRQQESQHGHMKLWKRSKVQ
jgi:arginase family enzyme